MMKRGFVGVVGANSHGCLGSTPRASGPKWRKGIATLFFNKQEYLDLFEYLTNPWVCAVPPSHTYRVITRRNPMAMAPRCWQEVSNQESHRYILGGLRNYYVNPLKL